MASLSKSKYQAGLRCQRQLWLQCNRYKDRDPLTAEQKERFAHGTDVGNYARTLFPDGELIHEDHFHADAAIAHTQAAIGRRVAALFEPAFRYQNLVVRADLLSLDEATGRWDLHEVKASGHVYPNHITDAAVQAWAIEGCGVPVGGIFLTHPTSGRMPQPGEDPWGFFAAEDISGPARAHISEVDRTVAEQNSLILLPEPPDVPFGDHCEKPYRCSHFEYCHRGRSGS